MSAASRRVPNYLRPTKCSQSRRSAVQAAKASASGKLRRHCSAVGPRAAPRRNSGKRKKGKAGLTSPAEGRKPLKRQKSASLPSTKRTNSALSSAPTSPAINGADSKPKKRGVKRRKHRSYDGHEKKRKRRRLLSRKKSEELAIKMTAAENTGTQRFYQNVLRQSAPPATKENTRPVTRGDTRRASPDRPPRKRSKPAPAGGGIKTPSHRMLPPSKTAPTQVASAPAELSRVHSELAEHVRKMSLQRRRAKTPPPPSTADRTKLPRRARSRSPVRSRQHQRAAKPLSGMPKQPLRMSPSPTPVPQPMEISSPAETPAPTSRRYPDDAPTGPRNGPQDPSQKPARLSKGFVRPWNPADASTTRTNLLPPSTCPPTGPPRTCNGFAMPLPKGARKRPPVPVATPAPRPARIQKKHADPTPRHAHQQSGWMLGANLKAALERQQDVDPESIFPTSLYRNVSLKEIFPQQTSIKVNREVRGMDERRDTGMWQKDGLTEAEIIQYRKLQKAQNQSGI